MRKDDVRLVFSTTGRFILSIIVRPVVLFSGACLVIWITVGDQSPTTRAQSPCQNHCMNGSKVLRPEIQAEVGELISELDSAGWAITGSEFDKKFFGNWYVDLCRGNQTLRIVKDRSQYMVAGPPTQAMKDVGLWNAFDTFEEFRRVIKAWMVLGK